jgi:hypothetical protein
MFKGYGNLIMFWNICFLNDKINREFCFGNVNVRYIQYVFIDTTSCHCCVSALVHTWFIYMLFEVVI